MQLVWSYKWETGLVRGVRGYGCLSLARHEARTGLQVGSLGVDECRLRVENSLELGFAGGEPPT